MIARIHAWLRRPYRRGAAGIVALFLVIQLAGLPFMGLTDDDDFYIPAGVSYAQWLGQIITFDGRAWTRTGIDEAFKINHEHPPVAKYVFGICHFVFKGVLGPSDAARVGTVLFATLAAALLLVLTFTHLGARRGFIAGGFAVVALLTLPRFYFHSHAATLDVPVASMYLAAATLALLAERHRRAVIWAGVVFGLAAATKLNGPFLVVPYLAFAALVRWRRPASNEAPRAAVLGHFQLPAVPAAAVSMAVVGPIVFFASWPWMWFDTANRVREYVQFHLNHYGIYFLYFGRLYDKDPFAPWHAPFTMAAVTVPVAVSMLALIGVALAIPVVVRRLRSPSTDERENREADLILSSVLHAVVAICVVAFFAGPKYGGAKLFMPFFPF
ncbi:MAG: glycosyltransferase family 39 protein, partial [Myxococcota bacterium]